MQNRLCLGTAQFGLDYGIKNKEGKLPESRVFSILDRAFEKEVFLIDTASVYGDSEKILGDYFAKRKVQDKARVISKLRGDFLTYFESDISRNIENQIKQSLSGLKINCLEGYLLHNPEHLYNTEIIRSLSLMKEKGLIKRSGVSVYLTEQAFEALEREEIEIIQIPYNLFDQRWKKTDFFTAAKEKGKTIFSRSTFLQGFILLTPKEIPPNLLFGKIYLDRLDFILNKYNLSRLEACLKYVLNSKEVDFLLFGVDNVQQFDQIIEICSEVQNLPEKFIKEIEKEFSDVEETLLLPYLWNK